MNLTKQAKRYKLLGTPVRLGIVKLLLWFDDELCATMIGGSIESNISQPTLSQQLKLLLDGGILKKRREGKHVYYRLAKSEWKTLNDITN